MKHFVLALRRLRCQLGILESLGLGTGIWQSPLYVVLKAWQSMRFPGKRVCGEWKVVWSQPWAPLTFQPVRSGREVGILETPQEQLVG